MTAKADLLRKRLLSAGLTPEAVTKYIDTFRAFLSARLTKPRFEDEMHKILPPNKIHVHNEIIQDILHSAQQKREGFRDLPIVTPIKETRRPAPGRKERAQAQKGPAALKPEAKHATKGVKRPLEDTETPSATKGGDDVATPAAALSVPKKPRRTVNKNKIVDNVERGKMAKVKAVERMSPKVRRKVGEHSSSSLPPQVPVASGGASGGNTKASVAAAAAAVAAAAAAAAASTATTEIPTYDGLPYFPVRPGGGMDVELFLKLRQRMKRLACEEMGMAEVKDEAVGLLVRALEVHVKGLLGGGVGVRGAREGGGRGGVVRGYDVREGALKDLRRLGDESGMELERLLMLI